MGKTFKRLCAVLLVLCITVGLFSGCKSSKKVDLGVQYKDTIQITAQKQDSGLIAEDTAFSITSTLGSKLDKNLPSQLRLQGGSEFLTQQQGDGSYILTPKSPLPQNAVVTLALLSEAGSILKSWAFQTQTGFAVRDTMPNDGSAWAPVNTGIEVTFTLPVEEAAFMESFSLVNTDTSEKIAGSAKRYGNVMVFLPTAPLTNTTTYRATIAGGLSAAGKTLGEDYVFEFATEQDEKGSYFDNASPVSETFLSQGNKVIAVNCDESFRQKDVSLTLTAYKFPDAESYRGELEKYAALCGSMNGNIVDRMAPQVDIGKLQQLGTTTTAFMPGDPAESWTPAVLVLPDAYSTLGWYYYVLEAKRPGDSEPKRLHKFIQVSDLSVYSLATPNEALFWLHDANTGAPVAGAEAVVSGDVKSAPQKSGADGVARVSMTNQDTKKRSWGVADIQGGAHRYVSLLELPKENNPNPIGDFYAYLYTDRPIYQSSDTMKVFGLLRPREGTVETPKTITLSLGSREDSLYTVPVTLDQNGLFSTEISFKNLGGTQTLYETLNLYVDESERSVYNRNINIGDYVKPDYLPDITTARPAYFGGEQLDFTFTATFFDGTPAHGFDASIRVDSMPTETKLALTTGPDGKAAQSVALPTAHPYAEDGSGNWQPQSIYYTGENASAENDNFYLSGSVPVFFRDLALRAELDSTAGTTPKVTVRTNRIVLENITKSDEAYDEKNFIGPTVDRPVTVELHKVYFNSIPNGKTYYDYVRKENIIGYDYERKDELVSSRLLETKNGELQISDLPTPDGENNYYLRLSTQDLGGKTVIQEVWLSRERYYYESGEHRYTLEKRGADPEVYQTQTSFSDNENVSFDLFDNQRPVTEGQMLAVVVQKGIESVVASGKPEVTLNYDNALIPNYTLSGAYFDGRHIYTVDTLWMNYDPKDRALKIDIKPDKEQYLPGEEATLALTVTYPDGTPAKDTPVQLSLTDEAVFAIEEDNANILDAIYATIHTAPVEAEASFRDYSNMLTGGAEKGGGGGFEGVRSDFVDNTTFLTLTTDQSGIATTKIQLPDNITSWRATAQGVTSDLRAGTATAPVKVSGRFFLNPVLPTTFLTGDKATISLRAYGEAIAPETPVDYTVILKRDGKEETITAAGKAADYTVLSLGELQSGNYTITMSAKAADKDGKELLDAVEKTITVLDSGVEAQVIKTVDIGKGLNIEAARYPVELWLYNQEFALYTEVLESLSSFYSSRADDRIAQRFFSEQSSKALGEPYNITDKMENVLSQNGGVSLFAYSDQSPLLSAKVNLAVPEYQLSQTPYDYFQGILGNSTATPADRAAAYLGLAAHKRPVLLEIQAALAGTDYNPQEKLLLIAALATLGDYDGATAAYTEIATPLLVDGTDSKGRATRFVENADINESIRQTALCSLAASVLGNADANPIMHYLLDNSSTMDSYSLERVIYLQYMRPVGEDASVTYKKDGKTQKLDLSTTAQARIRFSEEGLKKANLKVKTGKVGARVQYAAGRGEVENQEGKTIALTRTMEPQDAQSIALGGVVKITITPTIASTTDPNGLRIDDYIPSGMRFLSVEQPRDGKSDSQDDGSAWELLCREGQRVSFAYRAPTPPMPDVTPGVTPRTGGGVSAGDTAIPGTTDTADTNPPAAGPQPGQENYPAPKPLVFYARVASSGSYVVESAYARAADGSPFWGATDRTVVEIG